MLAQEDVRFSFSSRIILKGSWRARDFPILADNSCRRLVSGSPNLADSSCPNLADSSCRRLLSGLPNLADSSCRRLLPWVFIISYYQLLSVTISSMLNDKIHWFCIKNVATCRLFPLLRKQMKRPPRRLGQTERQNRGKIERQNEGKRRGYWRLARMCVKN